MSLPLPPSFLGGQMKSAARILLGKRKLGQTSRERFCPACGTLLTHDGFVWICRYCTERVGIEIRLMAKPSPPSPFGWDHERELCPGPEGRN